MFTLFLILSVVLFIARFILKNAFPRFADKYEGFIFLIYVIAIMLLVIAIVGALCLGGQLITEDVIVNEIANCEVDIAYFEGLLPNDGALINADNVAYRNNLFELRERVRDLKKDLDLMDTYRWWLYFGGI